MQPAVSDVPDVAKFDEGYGFGRSGVRQFAIASVDVHGRERSFHAVSHETSAPSMQTLAAELARSVSQAVNFRGMNFRYTRPDPVSPPPSGDERSAAT